MARLAQSPNWHTIYMRMNRWSNGVLDRVFAAATRTDRAHQARSLSLDRTIVKGIPTGLGR